MTDAARFPAPFGSPSGNAIPLPDLLGDLAPVAARYAASFPGGGTLAVLSMWSQFYLLALVPGAVTASLDDRRDLPLGLEGMAAELTEQGQPCRLCLPHPGCATQEACPIRRLSPLLRLHLAPLAVALAKAGLPRTLFWSNAAATLNRSLDACSAAATERATIRAVMSAPCWADGAPNPFRSVLGHDPARRRVCCLRVRLPGWTRCPDCPVRLP